MAKNDQRLQLQKWFKFGRNIYYLQNMFMSIAIVIILYDSQINH